MKASDKGQKVILGLLIDCVLMDYYNDYVSDDN